jgi:hypothetical protein
MALAGHLAITQASSKRCAAAVGQVAGSTTGRQAMAHVFVREEARAFMVQKCKDCCPGPSMLRVPSGIRARPAIPTSHV